MMYYKKNTRMRKSSVSTMMDNSQPCQFQTTVIWKQFGSNTKERIQNQKVDCTQHTLWKSAAFKELDPEKKDYYCDTCFDVGKCGARAVEKPHYHYCIPNRQGEDRHLYQVKVNAPIARDAKNHILEACVIAAVVAFHKCNPNKLIFISIHFH